MKSIEVKGSLREEVGKQNSKDLRKEKNVPCVLYGNGDNVHFQLEEKAFKDIVYTPNAFIIDLYIGKELHKVMLRDFQFYPVTYKILHADFY